MLTHIWFRRTVYSFFILIFLAITPAVILYTQGYRYNFKYHLLQKTGLLVLSSLPKRAEIFLNGQIWENKTTPTRLENMMPGDYEIALKKSGYHDWQKKLPIMENGSTFAEDVILWKNVSPTAIDTAQAAPKIASIKIWRLSPTGDKIAIVDAQNQIFILEFKKILFETPKENFYFLVALPDGETAVDLAWADGGKKILIQTAASHYLIQDKEKQPDLIRLENALLPAGAENVNFDEKSDNRLFAQTAAGPWQIDLTKKTYRLLANLPATDYWIKNNDLLFNNEIYFLIKGVIYRRNENGKQPDKIAETECSNCRFFHWGEKIILRDESAQKLIFIDPNNFTSPITVDAKAVDWLSNKTLLFYNDWEIWLYEFDHSAPELVTRLSEPISQVVWHPLGRHLIFSVGGQVKVIELDNRELRNIIELASINRVDNLSLDEAGKNLYFSGLDQGEEKIFKLNIR